MNKNENQWILKEKINESLNEEQIKDLINKKLAFIIIELETNRIIWDRNYIVRVAEENEC